MLIEQLDRTQWTTAQAVEHVAERLRALVDADPDRLKDMCPSYFPAWMRGPNLEDLSRTQARTELLVALRDGDLHATGRFSDQRVAWLSSSDGWGLHSGHHSSIMPEHWRAGSHQFSALDRLTMIDGQFIDIRMPRFAVLAIWPIAPTQPGVPRGSYRTPYLDLIDQAIAEFQISDDVQPKKDNLVDWFKTQTVEGESVSENLAGAMATLVRLPASQRGGARRGIGGN